MNDEVLHLVTIQASVDGMRYPCIVACSRVWAGGMRESTPIVVDFELSYVTK